MKSHFQTVWDGRVAVGSVQLTITPPYIWDVWRYRILSNGRFGNLGHSMDYKEYKLMRLIGAIPLCLAAAAYYLEATIGAVVALTVGLTNVVIGMVGAWFNE